MSKTQIDVMFSSQSDEWETPRELYETLDKEFGFSLDPCATPDNAKCATYFTRSEDGLCQDWSGHNVFMNPPYGRAISRWIKKAFDESKRGALVVCLVPSRTDTSYWHDYCMNADEIRYIRGRIRFGNAKHGAPFPSAVVIFGNKVEARR